MKKILIAIIALLLIACQTEPVLKKNEYKIIDTIDVSRNGFNTPLGYHVVIKYDSSFYYGYINTKGKLVEMNPRKIKLENYK